MINIQKFISNNNVDYATNLINETDINLYERKIGICFGDQLIQYLLKYGYLGFEYIEFYGINSKQGYNSDMVKQTLYLHKYYEATKPYIAFENCGEGDYILVDSEDNVYKYISETNQLSNLGIKLFDYILSQFESI